MGELIVIFDDVGNVIFVMGELILLDVFVILDVVMVVWIVEMGVLIEEMK